MYSSVLRDLAICLLATANILLFSFIGLNHEAFQKLISYEHRSDQDLEQIFQNTQNLLAVNFASLNNQQKKSFLSIPKINLIAPIAYEQKESIEQVEGGLSRGIISLSRFIHPGEIGNNILFGHSSDYPWNKNPYGTIFTLLPKLSKGDRIDIINGDKTYSYIVQKTQITDSTLSRLIDNPSNPNQLILSTCYPIGFFSKRFNVVAIPLNNKNVAIPMENNNIASLK